MHQYLAEMKRRVKRSTRIILFGDDLRQRELEVLTDHELGQIKAVFPQPKFFVFGHARSGTTLLARLLRVHPEVHCSWQAHFFTRPPFLTALVRDADIEEWLKRRSNLWNQGSDYSTLLLRSVCDFMLERESRELGKIIVGDKSPNNLVHGEAVRRLHAVYPDARLIYIIRDGRDAVLSHVLQDMLDHPERLPKRERRIQQALLKDAAPFFSRRRSLFTSETMRTRARDWKTNVSETMSVGKELFTERFTSLRFEDLLKDPHRELGHLWGFLGAVPLDDAMRRALDLELGLRPDEQRRAQQLPQLAELKRKETRGAWREVFTSRDVEIFHEVAGDMLAEIGYEPV